MTKKKHFQVEYQVTANVYLLSFLLCSYLMCVLSYYYIFVKHYSQHGCQQTNSKKNNNREYKNVKLSLKKGRK